MRRLIPVWRRAAPNEAAAAAEPPPTQARLFDEELLARLRRLVILSRRTVAEGLAGEHRSRRRGSSPEFADFKRYSQGDEFRRIDWNTFARLDSLFIRLSEVTTELDVHILLDASNSMDWRGGGSGFTKFEYARRATGGLSYVALWHFDRIVIAPFGAALAPAFGPSQGRAHLVPMLRYLENLAPLGQTALPTVLDQYIRSRRRPGILVLVSDLLSGEPDQLRDALRTARARGWQAIVVHVLDPAELSPLVVAGAGGRAEPAELVEVESDEHLRLTPTADVVARYKAALNAWLDAIVAACDAEHADYLRLQTDWPFETLVLRLLYEQGVVA